jgi:cytochrome oxidase assembly protein ShyY1
MVTPPQANINVAFSIYPGWEKVFSSHLSYLVTMIGMAAGYFFITEYVLRRWLGPELVSEGRP